MMVHDEDVINKGVTPKEEKKSTPNKKGTTKGVKKNG